MSTGPPASPGLEGRQLLDACGIKAGKCLRDRDALDPAIRRNLSQRRQHKGAFEQMRMRQGQAGLLDFNGVKRDDVDIENARAPAPFLGAVATKHRLDGERPVEEGARRQRGFDHDREIDERRLVGHAPWRRTIVRGTSDELNRPAIAQRGDGTTERRSHIPQIAAEHEERLRHGASATACKQEPNTQVGEDDGAHAFASIAAMTRSACTVAATSWARMIVAPRSAARIWAASDPPSRWSGAAGTTALMRRLREAPTRSGRSNVFSRSSLAIAAMLCSAVLPKPMPGSSTMRSRAMPERAAMASERSKNAAMSAMMSIRASATSRLCMTMTGTR